MEANEKKIAIEQGKKLANIGFSFQLLLALHAISPVKRFRLYENLSWEVEFSDISPPIEIPSFLLKNDVKMAGKDTAKRVVTVGDNGHD